MTQAPPPPPRASAISRFGLIIIGDEILSGKRADKHLPKVIELLKARGLQLDYADYVGDSPERITATLKRAFASGDVVFSCGGIGATPDDHTRQCAAQALGLDLVLHPQAETLIRQRMQDLAREQGIVYEADRPDNIHRLNHGGYIPRPLGRVTSTVSEGHCENVVEPRSVRDEVQPIPRPSGAGKFIYGRISGRGGHHPQSV